MSKRAWRGFVVGLAVLTLGGLAGCGPYVTIPRVGPNFGISDPNQLIVRDAMRTSLKAELTEDPVKGPYSVKLPPGSEAKSYHYVMTGLPGQPLFEGETTPEGAAGAVSLEVIRVHIQNLEGEVDIVRKGDRVTGQGQLITVYLRRAPFNGWVADRVRTWSSMVEPEKAVR